MPPAASPEVELRQIGLGFTRLLFPFWVRKQPTQHPHKLLNSTERLDLRYAVRILTAARRSARSMAPTPARRSVSCRLRWP